MNVSLEEAAVVERNFARRLARAHVDRAELVRGQALDPQVYKSTVDRLENLLLDTLRSSNVICR